MSIETDAGQTYVLGTTAQEYERVRRQAQLWERATERVLDRVDPAVGSRCLDAGCGPGVTMRQLAQRVGPRGRVVGIDVDGVLGAAGVDRLHDEGHRQCEFHAHDLRSDAAIPGAPYDLVYTRLVLFHLPERVAVLSKLWDAVAPGGHLVVQDYDLSVVGSVPRTPIDERLVGLLMDAFTAAGCEVRAGSLLPRLFEQAGVGLPDATDVAGRLDRLADAASMLEATIRSALPAAIGCGLVTESDAHALLAGLHEEVSADPDRPFRWPLLIGAWKRRGS
ncbi:MAG TPA: methyltransferase domain-containing protein [Mycobacteriales bacterium]|nr:methyltransferase domain-containing protein [Mycobacteriales bacterium]